MDKVNIGKIIKQGRINKNISQGELAQEFGVTKSAISAWETNKTTPPAHALIALAKKLDIVDELFREEKNGRREMEEIWQAINEIREKIGLK